MPLRAGDYAMMSFAAGPAGRAATHEPPTLAGHGSRDIRADDFCSGFSAAAQTGAGAIHGPAVTRDQYFAAYRDEAYAGLTMPG